MNHSFLLYITLTITLFTPLSNASFSRTPNSETDPIALTCRLTTDFGFCVATLRSDPRSAGATRDGLTHIAVDLLQNHAKDTVSNLQDMQKSASDRKEKDVVETCLSSYQRACDKEVPAAMKSLDSKAYNDAVESGLGAKKDGEDCQKKVDENPSSRWEKLCHSNVYMRDLAQLSVDLIKLLGK